MRRLAPALLLAVFVACDSDDGLTVHTNDFDPEVVFLEPANDELFVEGEEVVFRARAEDQETAREDLQLIWSSTRGGTLTVDTLYEDDAVSIVISDLEPGEQTVSLKAIDERAQEAEGAVTVVIEENLAPSLSILSPTDEGIYSTGLAIPVEVQVSDDHFDAVDIELVWGGAATGAPDAPSAPDAQGTAEFDLSALPAAAYTIAITATDPYGKNISASVSFEVVNGDLDGDGHVGIAQGGDDCDDTDADVFPTQTESCNDADDNCNGQVDEGLTDAPYYFDGDNDGYGVTATLRLECGPPAGWTDTSGDCDDGNDQINPAMSEICDGLDNDCAGGADDGLPVTAWFFDSDDDGYGRDNGFVMDCEAPPDHVDRGGDCDDNNEFVNPDETEVCNGIDDDCTAGVDDGFSVNIWATDADSDGYGAAPVIEACAQPPGMVNQLGDCDDSDPAINEGETEICGNGVDEDCSGTADDNCFSDYTGTWDIVPNVNTNCGWGQFHPIISNPLPNAFGTIDITDNYPSVIAVTGGNPDGDGGALTGTFDTPTHFVATSHVENFGSDNAGFDEDYVLDITFDSWTELTGSIDMIFEDTPATGGCTDRSFNFTGVRL